MPPVTLGPHFEGFVRDQIARGRFKDESEVIRAGLRLLEDRESLLSDHREDLLRTIDAAFDNPRPSIPAGDAFALLRAHHADRVKAADRGDWGPVPPRGARRPLRPSYLHRTTVRLDRADLYLGETEAACLSLADFPERGTRRDDLRPGLRTLGFRRQATIVFRIREDGVGIGRILYRGRDLTALASSDEG